MSKKYITAHKLTKPTTNANIATAKNIAIAGIGTGIILDDEISDRKANNLDTETLFTSHPSMSLWNYIRLYTICSIPVADFLVVYLILYIINRLIFNYDYRYAIVLTAPLVIFINMVTNTEFEMSIFALVLIAASLIYLIKLRLDLTRKKN